MLLQPPDETPNETAEMRQGTVQVTLLGWQMLDAKITELRHAGATYLWIAESMGITENTLRKLRREKDAYRTNLTDLEGIFNVFGEGRRPQEITPEKGAHYEYVLQDPSATRATKFPLPYELQYFQGREQELQTLRNGFAQGKSKQAINGLGGMGKTQLALKYALHFRNEYNPVFWVHADTEESIESRYAEFAHLLGLLKNRAGAKQKANPLTEEEARAKRQEEQAQAIAAFRHYLDTHDNWLLVLDNADAPEHLRRYLPRHPQGHILLTTRAHDLSSLDVHTLPRLEKLSETASLQFFLNRCSRHDANAAEHRAATDLAAELDYLPLAMAHAAAYIARLQTSFAYYLKLYRERKLALMDSSGVPGEDTYLISIRATWEINFRALDRDWGTGRAGMYARDLLNFCAFIGSEDILCELVLAGAKEYCPQLYDMIAQPRDGEAKQDWCSVEDEEIFHDLLLPLIQYSLVNKSLEPPPRFSIHRMVQLAIADRLGDQKRDWLEKTLRVVDGAFPIPEAANWQACERLLPHAVAVADSVRQEGLAMREAGRLLCYLGEFLMNQGRYAQAALYARYALRVRETFAAEHPLNPQYLLDLAVSLQCLSSICHHQQKLEEAQTLLERALTIRQQHSAENDPETLRVYNDLAAVYNSRQLYPQAENIYLELLERAEAIGADGASVTNPYQKAAIRHNLGNSCYWQGRLPEAAQWFNATLTYWAEYSVGNHPHPADTWHDLAQTYRRMRHPEAEACYKKALEIQLAAYPQGHPRIAITLYNIADFYKDANRLGQAEEYYQKTLVEDIRVFGKIHPEYVSDLKVLADLYRRMERQEAAEEAQQEIGAILRKLAENEDTDALE